MARQHNKAAIPAPKGRPPRAKSLNLPDGERGKQVLRLFFSLRALENTRRGLTVEELHALLEDRCTMRTVYRDLEQLQHAGFAMDVEEGRYKLSAASRSLAATPLRADEVLALLLSGHVLEPIAATAVVKTRRSLRERLVASLTSEGRAFLSEQRDSLRATNPSPTQLTATDSTLTAIEQGRALEQCVQLCSRRERCGHRARGGAAPVVLQQRPQPDPFPATEQIHLAPDDSGQKGPQQRDSDPAAAADGWCWWVLLV